MAGQGPEKEYLGKLQYELKYDFNTQVGPPGRRGVTPPDPLRDGGAGHGAARHGHGRRVRPLREGLDPRQPGHALHRDPPTGGNQDMPPCS